MITLSNAVLRRWRAEDAGSLVRHANDRRISINMRDAFPYPYGAEDAKKFLALAAAQRPETWFAIVIDGEAAGGIGYTLHQDVERVSAEIGYWLGTAHWGRGIATDALRAVTAHAFREHAELQRLYAVPFAWNPASARVLEKAGYTLEGRMRQSAIKEGRLTDQLLYAIVRGQG